MNQPALLVTVLYSASLMIAGPRHAISGPFSATVCMLCPIVAVPSQSSSPEKISAMPAGASLQVELTKSLDARNVKPGDDVTAKLMQDVKSNGSVVLPSGSKVIGHVAEAQPRDKQHPES